jgi:hypothetical protein
MADEYTPDGFVSPKFVSLGGGLMIAFAVACHQATLEREEQEKKIGRHALDEIDLVLNLGLEELLDELSKQKLTDKDAAAVAALLGFAASPAEQAKKGPWTPELVASAMVHGYRRLRRLAAPYKPGMGATKEGIPNVAPSCGGYVLQGLRGREPGGPP